VSDQEGQSGFDLSKIDEVANKHRLTRRGALQGAAALGALAALGPVASACGSSSSSGSSAAPSASASGPKKGGAIKAGIGGGSAKDTLDAQIATNETQITIQFQIYDSLLGWDAQSKLVNLLAESYEANTAGDEWTVKLKSGLTFHDGKSVTADDVIFSYQRILDPKTAAIGAAGLASLKPGNIKKIDDLTVKFVLNAPDAIFTEQLAYYNNAIVPVGYDPKTAAGAIGTGPWKVTSYTPAQQIEFAANTNYWGEGPYADTLTLIEYADPTAKLNALLSGAIDYATILDSAQVSTVKSSPGFKIVEAKTGGWDPFTMRVDKKPFDDVRVRQAMRLIVDRQQMIDQAYGGFSWLGNDVFAPYDPGYPTDLPQRVQDLEQAKSLLKQAGYDNSLTVTLNCSTATGAADVQAAQVFAEQAKAAGVTIKVNKVDPNAFWNTGNYLSYPFAMTFWATRNYLSQAQRGYVPAQNGAPAAAYWGETGWNDPEWLKLYNEAVKTVDDTKRNDLVSQMCRIDYDRGGYIIYQFNIMNDGYSDKLAGVVPDAWGAEAASKGRFNLMYFA
jgi:peptide/nickel transport system substrate-binding protein